MQFTRVGTESSRAGALDVRREPEATPHLTVLLFTKLQSVELVSSGFRRGVRT